MYISLVYFIWTKHNQHIANISHIIVLDINTILCLQQDNHIFSYVVYIYLNDNIF